MITVDMKDSFWDMLKTVVVGILVGALVILAIALTAGAIGAVATGIMAALAIGGTVSVSIGTGAVVLATGAGIWSAVTYYNTQLPTNVVLPMFSLSPEEIFEGKILFFDIDFFNPVTEILEKHDDEGNLEYYYYLEDGEEIPTSKQNTALELQSVVSQWYNALRNIAIVLSMSVLLYIGIRMLLSTIAQDKAKYKQMLIDWVVGLCLLFFMHYIMSFSVTIVKQFNKLIVYNQEQDLEDVQGYTGAIELDEDDKIRKKLEDIGQEDLIQETQKIDENGNAVDAEFVIWPTNLMGQLRIAAQMSYGDAAFIGYSLCYFILTLLTIFFIFVYLKRVLYMAFLTMIAPLVALTYPIDKINDGQAQGFNRWLKEYIFNLLIQPLHLIIYTVLVSSAFELASTNAIYSLVAIAFLIPAEKLMRSLFGFEKANTPPSMAGAAVGAGLVSTGLQKLLHKGPSGTGNGKSNNEENTSTLDKIRSTNNTNAIDGFASSLGGNNPNNDNSAQGTDVRENSNDGNDYDGNDYGDNVDNSAEEMQAGNNPPDNGYSLFGMAGNGIKGLAGNTKNKVMGTKVGQGLQNGKKKVSGAVSKAGKWSRDRANDAKHVAGAVAGSVSRPFVNVANSEKAMNMRRNAKAAAGFIANSNEGKAIRKITGRVGNAVKENAQGFGRAYKTQWKQNVKGFKQGLTDGVRQAPRVIGAATLGATAGAIGIAAGLATGDPSNVLSYGAGAALAGGSFGSRALNIPPRSGERTAAQIARDRAFYGDRYEEHVANQDKKRWKRDSGKREELEQYLGEEKVKDLYKNRGIDKYLDNGIADPKMIAAMEKMQEEDSNLSFNDVLTFKEGHDIYGNGTKRMGNKNKEELLKDYTQQFKDRHLTDEQADFGAHKIANGVDKLSAHLGKL